MRDLRESVRKRENERERERKRENERDQLAGRDEFQQQMCRPARKESLKIVLTE